MRKAALALVLVALVVEIVALIVFGGGDDDDGGGGPARPVATGEVTDTPQPAPGPTGGPITDACSLVSLNDVAKAVGVPSDGVKPQPRPQGAAAGVTCDFVEQSEDRLRVFTVTVQDAGDPGFASATISARRGKRLSGLGDVAVFESTEFRSQVSVAKGSRYVQLQSHRKPASEDAMVGLARQAVGKL